MGRTPYTLVTSVAPAVLKNHVYLGHCTAHSEESSKGEEGNALDGQPQLLNGGLVLQQVIQLWVMNLNFPFSTAPNMIMVLHLHLPSFLAVQSRTAQ